MDQRCLRGNCPTLLGPRFRLRLSLNRHIPCAPQILPRPPIRSSGRRRNTVVADSGSKTKSMQGPLPMRRSSTWLHQKLNVNTQKIDGPALVTYGMVVAGFLLQDKLGKVRFLEETFLLANTSIKVVLGMLFPALSNADIRFAEKDLVWRSWPSKSSAGASILFVRKPDGTRCFRSNIGPKITPISSTSSAGVRRGASKTPRFSQPCPRPGSRHC